MREKAGRGLRKSPEPTGEADLFACFVVVRLHVFSSYVFPNALAPEFRELFIQKKVESLG